MKSIRVQFLPAAALTAALFAVPLLGTPAVVAAADAGTAAQQAVDHSHERGWHAKKHQHKKAVAERMGGGWAMKGFKGLDLDEKQQDKLFEIRQASRTAAYEQRKVMRSAAKTLRELSQAEKFDESDARKAADDLGKAKAELALLQARTHAEMRTVLTAEQLEKLAARKSRSK